jgi:uracil-DNA glycosylase family 4
MQGFFSLKEIMEASATSAPTEPFCNDCGLFRYVRSPKMPFTGSGRKQTLIIAEVPGETEDLYNRQLVGVTGQWLEKKLKSFGYDLYKDFWLTNSVNCRTLDKDGNNRNPTPLEVNHCRPYVESIIKQLNPKAIIIFGEASCRSFFGPLFKDNIKIGEWEGLAIPSRKFNSWLLPLYHPQYAIRNSQDENMQAYFDITLKKALDSIERPFPQFDDHTKKVKLLYKIDDICQTLTEVLDTQPEIFFFDYEANGLRPQRMGYKIVTQSFSTNPNEAISFPFQYRHYLSANDQIRIKSLWRKIMLSPKIKKVAHNFKFEYSLTKNIFGCDIANRYWCTMDAAHIEDTRFKYTGLKKQAFLKFGIEPYNEHIEPYLQEVGNTGFNRIEEVDLEELLEYGAYDSLIGHRLLLEQKKTLTNEREPGCGSLADAREFFFEAAKCFMEISDRGFPSDIEYYRSEKKRLQDKIAELKQQIKDSREAQLFLEQKGREIKIGKQLSDDDMRIILFDILKIPPHKLTSGGMKPSVDSDSLERIDLPFVKTVVDLKHHVKIDGNYINGFIRETIDGLIHPSINLNIARSLRSCIAKGTMIDTVRDISKFPNGIPIENVVPGDYVFCFDDKLNPQIKKVLWSGKTGEREVIRIHWKGHRNNRGYIDVTPEHKIRLADGRWIEAQNLTGDYRTNKDKLRSPKIRVLSLNRRGDQLYFTGHTGKHNTGVLEHRFIYEQLVGSLDIEDIVHHKDLNHFNHTPNNLAKESKSSHASFHFSLLGSDPKIREQRSIIMKRKRKENPELYANSGGKGLQLSKFTFLKALAKSKGKPTQTPYDYSTVITYCSKFKVDYKEIAIRYDIKGKYISKSRLEKAIEEGRGFNSIRKELGHNYYRFKDLLKLYGIELKRKWGNQHGEFVPNNHIITGIEKINKVVEVYDLEIEDCHNFIANEINVHNSCSDPNLQNVPIREEMAKKSCRSGMFPEKGHQLLFADYKGIEVCVAAMYSGDKNLIRYITDPKSDMHKDKAMELWKLSPNEVTKDIRFYAKNKWVFAQFYGDWYGACAEQLWFFCLHLKTASGITLEDHLINIGMFSRNTHPDTQLKAFKAHCKTVEDRMWGEQFGDLKQWQLRTADFYRKKGYVVLKHGFRRGGYQSMNQLGNTPIQGTAFHLLCKTITECNLILKREQLKSSFLLQIHDESITNLFPPEYEHVRETLNYVGTKKIREDYEWINVPLTLEFESAMIGAPWYYKTEIDEAGYCAKKDSPWFREKIIGREM